MQLEQLYQKALNFEYLTKEEGMFLFENAPLAELSYVADTLRKKQVPHGKVTWQIDRNLNTTNVCIANCKFCNFYRIPGHPESYITDMDTYRVKIKETIAWGGDQLLLQGGHHPELGLDFYANLFKQIKAEFPDIKLHTLGPPEIAHIAKIGGHTQEWLDVMAAAHQLNITSSATMMFGHVETLEERFIHLIKIREVQDMKPEGANGFLAFIPWTFQDVDTLLTKIRGVHNLTTTEEYIRMIAISRIMLPNIKNIQASWLTVGKATAQVCLEAGANDFGSIMLEENVVSAAGAPHRFTYKSIQEAIKEAGFEPQLRNQHYEWRELPQDIQEQVIDY